MTFTILDLKIPKPNCKSTIVRCQNYNKFDEYLFQQDILNSLNSQISHGNVSIYADDISLDCSAPSLVEVR